ncbi:MAG: UDP-N-acetylglucosamine 1-carboxyvinyltransferase [Clostridiales bacterium]|nr:UDP-N-acetylglucosamine 1-carboxyvinyltransferase [Clostridiales bacterium]
MDSYVIKGRNPLYGRVEISGAKNAAVAIIPACILSDGECKIENVPYIKDTSLIAHIIKDMGADVRMEGKSSITVEPSGIVNPVPSYDLVRNMRASYYLLGALLGKFKQAEVAMPGGCNFGVRPVDQHLKGFEALGAECICNGDIIRVKADKLVGAHIYFDVISVGATINVMLAAVKAEGMTIIENAAREPHIVDVANFLNSMGANIRGAGTDVIKIKGVQKLHGVTYSVIPDQIEAGTYMTAVAATGGDVLIDNVIPKHLESITAKLREIGVEITEYDEAVRVTCNKRIHKCNIKTMPHPGFPTDMQPQFAALLSIADGTSVIEENVWNSRFQYINELCRFGAKATVDVRKAIIEGRENLIGATVHATDLRAGAAMIIAALAAEGVSVVEDVNHIERGYEDIVNKLRNIGADIRRRSDDMPAVFTA